MTIDVHEFLAARKALGVLTHPEAALTALRHLDITRLMHHDVIMRTTLTLEDDVAKEIEARMRREGTSLKALVNDLLRKGLRAGDKPLRRQEPVRIETFSSPFVAGVDVGRLNQLNDELEVAEFLRKRGEEKR